jgi:hypothetical protein
VFELLLSFRAGRTDTHLESEFELLEVDVPEESPENIKARQDHLRLLLELLEAVCRDLSKLAAAGFPLDHVHRVRPPAVHRPAVLTDVAIPPRAVLAKATASSVRLRRRNRSGTAL